MTTVAIELDKLQKTSRNAKDIDGETLELYAEELDDLPPSVVIQAIRELRKTSTFFPSLAEIRTRAVQIVAGPVLVDPESAWGEVLREVRRVGREGRRTSFMGGQSVVIAQREFTSPLIESAVESIGWTAICDVENDDLGTLRAQFRDALRVVQAREVDRVVSGRATDGEALSALQRGTLTALPEKGAA